MAHACHASGSTSVRTRLVPWYGHLGDLALVLKVVHVGLIEFLFIDNSLLIKQSLGESMILTFDTLCFSLSHTEIQTCRLVHATL